MRTSLLLVSLVSFVGCATPRAALDPVDRERTSVMDEASASLASLQLLVAALPVELQPLRERAEAGEAGEALQRALVDLVERGSAVAEDAERTLEPLRALRQPPPGAARLDEEATGIATAARARAVQALELAEAVALRTCGPGAPSQPPEDVTVLDAQELVTGAVRLAAAGLAASLAGVDVRRLVVAPVSVTHGEPAREESAAVYGRRFSRDLAAALSVPWRVASFSSRCARSVEGPWGAQAALVSGTLSLHGSEATFNLSVVGLRDRDELAVAQGTFVPEQPSF